MIPRFEAETNVRLVPVIPDHCSHFVNAALWMSTQDFRSNHASTFWANLLGWSSEYSFIVKELWNLILSICCCHGDDVPNAVPHSRKVGWTTIALQNHYRMCRNPVKKQKMINRRRMWWWCLFLHLEAIPSASAQIIPMLCNGLNGWYHFFRQQWPTRHTRKPHLRFPEDSPRQAQSPFRHFSAASPQHADPLAS